MACTVTVNSRLLRTRRSRRGTLVAARESPGGIRCSAPVQRCRVHWCPTARARSTGSGGAVGRHARKVGDRPRLRYVYILARGAVRATDPPFRGGGCSACAGGGQRDALNHRGNILTIAASPAEAKIIWRGAAAQGCVPPMDRL